MSTPSTPDAAERRIGELGTLLERLERLNRELHAVLKKKLEFMKHADIDRSHTCVGLERDLVARIAEQDGLRKQLVERIGRTMGMSAAASRALSVTKLTDRLASTGCGRLRSIAAGLRDAVSEVRRMNSMVDRVAGDVLRHMREVFAAAAEAEPASGYSQSGSTVLGRSRELFEIVG